MNLISRSIATLLAGALLASPVLAADTSPFDLSPEQPGREHVAANPAAVAALPKDFTYAAPGKFTIGSTLSAPPQSTYALDTKTPVGADIDIASLIAESLGLELQVLPVAWADWPLALASGKIDAVISNVGVTEERKEKFDFSTYRQGLHGFFVHQDSKIASIEEPKDIAGLTIIVGVGTNQERILNKWNDQNLAAGLPAATLVYYDDEATKLLALRAGRADVIVQPHAQLVFIALRDGDFKKVGTLSAGWPERSDVAVTTRKGSGIAEPITIALNAIIQDGVYTRTLERWHIGDEALTESHTNPPGLPKF